MWITANWPAPANIHAITTTRHGGFSLPPYDQLNLGDHVGDNLRQVQKNRELLIKKAGLPASPRWLMQTHQTHVINANDWYAGVKADAIYSQHPSQVCSVLTADCLPILLTNSQGSQIAAIHAGWRGLAAGIIEKTIQKFSPTDEIIAWLGPAIGPRKFEVGPEVFEAFVAIDKAAVAAFTVCDNQHYLADIYALARQRLQTVSVNAIYGGDLCTVCSTDHFFSYRRDGICGRMATLIWIEPK